MININKNANIKTRVFWWNVFLKIIFLAFLFYFLNKEFFENQNLKASLDYFLINFEKGNILFFLFCILLMPLNWLLESYKWKILVNPFERMSLSRSFKGVLSGISVAILTPNRIGEYGGRMLLVEAINNWKAVISTLISSYAQNIWNIGFGLIAAMFFLATNDILEGYLYFSGVALSILLLFALLLIYFEIELATKVLNRWRKNKYISKALNHLILLEKYDRIILSKVLLGSFLRYFTYFFQYYFILRFFGLDVGFLEGFMGIGTIFLIQTSIPLPPIFGFFARGQIALLVWNNPDYNELSILGASYALWVINLIIPSILGNIIIISSNLTRTLGIVKNGKS